MHVFIEIHSGSQPIGNIYYLEKFPENSQPYSVDCRAY